MNPRPKRLKILEDYRLKITFTNGEVKIYNMKTQINKEFYRSLNDVNVFQTAKIKDITIEWENGIDIDPDELYINSECASK